MIRREGGVNFVWDTRRLCCVVILDERSFAVVDEGGGFQDEIKRIYRMLRAKSFGTKYGW